MTMSLVNLVISLTLSLLISGQSLYLKTSLLHPTENRIRSSASADKYSDHVRLFDGRYISSRLKMAIAPSPNVLTAERGEEESVNSKSKNKTFSDHKRNRRYGKERDGLQRKNRLVFDFRKIIAECRKTGVFTPGVIAAQNWLHSLSLPVSPETASSSSSSSTPSTSSSSLALTSVIQIFGYAGLVDDAIAATTIARDKGMRLNVYHYNAVLGACKRHKRYLEALSIFDNMRAIDKLQPDLVTNSTMIQIYGLCGSWERALAMYQRTIETNGGSDSDPILLTNILSALERNGRITECLSLWEKTARQVELSRGNNSSWLQGSANLRAFTTVVSACSKAGLHDRAASIFDDMTKTCGLQVADLDKITVYTLNNALEKAGPSAHMSAIKEKLNTRMSAFGSTSVLSPASGDRENEPKNATKVNFNALIAMSRKSGDFKAAAKAADIWMKEQKNYTPGGVTQVMNIYGLSKQPEKLLSTVRSLIAINATFNTQQVNMCLTSLIRCDRPLEALKLIQTMANHNRIPCIDRAISTAELRSQQDRTNTSNNRRKERSQRKPVGPVLALLDLSNIDFAAVTRDEYSFGCVFSALQKLGDWEVSIELFDMLPTPVQKQTSTAAVEATRIKSSSSSSSSLSSSTVEDKELNFPAKSIVMLNTVLTTAGRMGQWREALRIFRSVESYYRAEETAHSSPDHQTSSTACAEISSPSNKTAAYISTSVSRREASLQNKINIFVSPKKQDAISSSHKIMVDILSRAGQLNEAKELMKESAPAILIPMTGPNSFMQSAQVPPSVEANPNDATSAPSLTPEYADIADYDALFSDDEDDGPVEIRSEEWLSRLIGSMGNGEAESRFQLGR